MQTYSANALAEQFEIDRSTAIRVLKNVPCDATTKGKGTYKIATFARALEQHRRSVGTSTPGGNGVSPLPQEYDIFYRAFDEMKLLPTLAKRRAAAIKLVPVIENMMKAMRAHALANREDPYVTGMRADDIYRLTLVGFREPCQWNHDEVWNALCIELD